MKRLILIAAVIILMPLSVSAMTADEVNEIVWQNTLDKQSYCGEVLDLMVKREDDPFSEPVRVGDIIDPEYSVLDSVRDPQNWDDQIIYLCRGKEDPEEYYSLVINKDENGELYVLQLCTETIYDRKAIQEKAANAITEFIDEPVTYIHMDYMNAEIGTESEKYILYTYQNNVLTAERTEGFYPISDSELLVDKAYLEEYEQENSELERQWKAEAEKKITERYPEIYTRQTRPDDDKTETDSLAAYKNSKSRYTDIAADMAPYMELLADKGIMDGYDDGSFKPENTVTRAEAAAVMSRLFRLEQNSCAFSDVPAGHWAEGYIGAFSALGIMGGYSDGTFRPDNAISYDELFKVAVLMMGYSDDYYFMPTYYSYPTGTTTTAINCGFADGLEDIKTDSAVKRGDLAIILCNLLDTHLCSKCVMVLDGEITYGGQYDITLVRYLDGEQINGDFIIRTESDAESWLNKCAEIEEGVSDITKELKDKLRSRYILGAHVYDNTSSSELPSRVDRSELLPEELEELEKAHEEYQNSVQDEWISYEGVR